MYAIVRAGGRQEKVSVGDVLTIDKVKGSVNAGDSVEFAPVLLVDGSTVTTDADTLGRAVVRAEVMEAVKGPKIIIQKYKNKTGYKKRQGHRQPLTKVKITAIDA
ncbi:50S ribosomal protein L21 [Ornithinimicrobium sp. W1679]|uniref:50S ribosomal protein L21 n=1 Tax=unclassified Ornithinimicrobium TaxID=2615080 RepID=UPI003CEF778B